MVWNQLLLSATEQTDSDEVNWNTNKKNPQTFIEYLEQKIKLPYQGVGKQKSIYIAVSFWTLKCGCKCKIWGSASPGS